MRARTELVRSLGVAVKEHNPDELKQRYSWMNVSDLTYAVEGLAGEGYFDGYSLMQWFRKRAREAGFQFETGEAARYCVTGDRITHLELTDGREISGDMFVNAAGAWCAPLARTAEIELPVYPRKRSAFVVSCPEAIPDLPILIDTSGVYVRREQNHLLCLVASPEEQGLDYLPLDVNFSEFDEIIWPNMAARIPAFEVLRIEHAWAGYDEYNSLDQNGLVGLCGPENSFLAAGFSGHGLMHSPGVGRAMAELLLFGAYQTLDLTPLSPDRLVTGKLLVEEAVY